MLSLTAIEKRFGGVRALRSADLQIREGQVHVLVGENGAGKSTLMKIVAGMYQPDAGTMEWRGKRVTFRNPAEAAAHGVSMVHQESLLAPHLTIAENMFLGREDAGRTGWVHRRGLVAKAQRVISDNGFRLDPLTLVGKLTPAGKQIVEICRAIAHSSSVLIFDEPTSSLSETETKEVFRIVHGLRQRGVATIYITHRFEELRTVGDQVTVLRDGATVHTGPLAGLTREQLIEFMVGRRVEEMFNRRPLPPGATLLRVQGVSRGILRNVSFELRAGEIVGLAGLMGAGRTELCRVLFGIDPPEAGTVEVNGKTVDARHPRQAIASGVALIPEDRQRHGLVLPFPIAKNITLPDLGRFSGLGVLRKGQEISVANEFRERVRVRCHSVQQRAGTLSGGNQQKIVIAKWVARGARVFLFDEPTRGIDVAAKQEVFQEMDRLAQSGAAILMVSSELSELTQIADRILVMCEGKLTGELPGRTTQHEIMHLAAPAATQAVVSSH